MEKNLKKPNNNNLPPASLENDYNRFLTQINSLPKPLDMLVSEFKLNMRQATKIYEFSKNNQHSDVNVIHLKCSYLPKELQEKTLLFFIDHWDKREPLLSHWGFYALMTGIITPEQCVNINVRFLNLFISENGITALRDDLITINQVINMPSLLHLHHLISTELGMYALRNELITPDEAAIFEKHWDLTAKLSDLKCEHETETSLSFSLK